METRTLVLDRIVIRKKIERMAFQILEDNYGEKEIILAGINTKGLLLARQLASLIRKIRPVSVSVLPISVHAANPILEEVSGKIDEDLNGKVVIIVDDVANTGRTLLYATKPFLDFLPCRLQTAVLVDRQHKTFPICPDYIGLSLSTTLQENIAVEVEGRSVIAVYLE